MFVLVCLRNGKPRNVVERKTFLEVKCVIKDEEEMPC
jgi:hypothetical protein